MVNNTLNKIQLIRLVKKLLIDKYSSERASNAALHTFLRAVPDPNALSLFHHDPELTAEEIVEKALSYKPIITPPPPKKDD